MLTIALFTVLFLPFFLVVGYLLRTRGLVFLEHTFPDQPRLASAINFLLNIGFYLICTALLLWNIAYPSFEIAPVEVVRFVALRLAGSITLVAFLHGFNVMVLILFFPRSAPSATTPKAEASRRLGSKRRPG